LVLTLGLTASGLASPVTAQSDPAASPSVSPIAFGEPQPLAAGTYEGSLGSGRWTVVVPEGWEWFYDVLWSDLGTPGTYEDVGGPGEVALGWWQADNVYVDPCHWSDSLAEPPVGPTADDLTAALAAQVGRDGPEPTDVTIGGYPAQRLEQTVPADLAACDEGAYKLFTTGDEAFGSGPEPYGPDAGSILTAYVLDVEGDRDVLLTWHLPDASDEDLAELEAMLESMVIERAAG
jgi:hypothetical protein